MNKRVKWIDVAKGIGVICIVLGHITIYKDHWKFVQFLYGFDVGLFFVLSGITFKKKIDTVNFKELIYSIIRDLVIPYAICALIIIVFKRFYTDYSPFWVNLKLYALQRRKGTLWFIPVLGMAKVLCWLANRYIKNFKIRTAAVAVFFVLGCIGLKYYKEFVWNVDIVPIGTFYVYVGILLSDFVFKINVGKFKSFMLGEALLALSFGSTIANRFLQQEIHKITITNINIIPLNALSVISGSLGIIFLAMAIEWFFPLSYLGRNSFGIIAFNTEIAFEFIWNHEPIRPYFTGYIDIPKDVSYLFLFEMIFLILINLPYSLLMKGIKKVTTPILKKLFKIA